MKPQSPCKDCKEREVGCHAACKKYAGYCKELESWKQTVKAAQTEGQEADSFRHHTFTTLQKHGKVGRK